MNNSAPLAHLLKLTLGSAVAYFAFQLAILLTNMLMLVNVDGLHAGTTKGQYIISFIINAVVTGGLYFWVYSLLKRRRSLGRILGSVAAAVAAFGTLSYVLLTFGVALIAAVFGLVFIVVNVLWLIAAWKQPVTDVLE